MKRLTGDNLVAHVLAWLARSICRRRWLFFYPQLVLFGLSIFYTVQNLQFDTNRDHLVGAHKKYQRNFLRFEKEFPQQSDLVVVVQSENPEKNRQFVERLGAKVETETNLFADVLYKGDLKMMGSKALLFVPKSDLVDLKKTLHDYLPFIQRFADTTNLASLFEMVNTEFRTAKPEKNAQTESLVNALPALHRIVSQADASLRHPGVPPAPGLDALFGGGEEAEQQVYVTYDHGRIFLLVAHALNDSLNDAAVVRLRQLVDQTKREVPGVNVGLTGESVLDHDEMAQSQKDTTLASIVALILCALIFIYGYQETGRPVKATLCLVIGLGYTLGFATLAVGHLNILTITFLPMLIGLAIDFGVHLITRYEEELRHGKSEEDALTKAMVFTGQGIFTGAFTTAGAFLAMGFTNFKGIQEMGIICGGGLVICLVPMMTMLPVLLLRGRQNVIDHVQGDLDERRAKIENIWLQRPVIVTFITLALCGLAASQLPRLKFDYNLLHMQSAGLPAVQYEQMLIHSAGKSVLFGAVIASNLTQAAELQEQLTNLPAVASVQSVAQYMTGDQTGKLRLIGEIKHEVAPLHFPAPASRPVNVPELSQTLYSLYGYLGAATQDLGTNDPALARQFTSLRGAIESFRKAMLSGSAASVKAHAQKLGEFQQALFNDLRETFEALKHQNNSSPLRVQDLPKPLRDRFVGVTGKFLLQVYPKKDLWQRANQREFIREVQKVDPKVTGTPVQLFYYTQLLKTSYEEAALYALGAIVILVFIHFRSVLSVLLSLLPVAIGSLWMCGLMGFFGIPFNPANIMTLPLVIGIGVTSGIHILNRFAEEQHPSILARSTGKAVFVSGLTTIAGFGSLILAKHQGIKSLGYVMATGVTTCMIAALTFLPALLNLMTRDKGQKNQPSADNAQSTLGREEPR